MNFTPDHNPHNSHNSTYMQQQLTEAELEEVYNWVDEIPLSRAKRNMARDFSDAELFAEIVQHYNPKLVEMHNYVATGSLPVKISNWKTLNRKVLSKIKMALKSDQIDSLANGVSGFIERLILRFKRSIEKGEIASPTTESKFSKSNTGMSFAGLGALGEQNKAKPYHKMSFHEIKKNKEVSKLVGGKDEEIGVLKEEIGLLVLKAGKMEEVLKSKDREIQQLVNLIKSKKIV